MSGEAGGGYRYPDDEDDEVVPDFGHLSASDRELLAWITGGGIHSREIQVEFSDEEEA